MRALIVANGSIPSSGFFRKLARAASPIIAADGGADSCIKAGIVPDYVIGDLDSISARAKSKFKGKILHDKDQDSTDLEKALRLAKKLGCKTLDIIGATGKKLDHTISNIIALSKVHVPCRILDNRHEIYLVSKSILLKGKKKDIVSVIPVSHVRGLTYSGLKWPVANKHVRTGWLGTSNEMKGSTAGIRLKSGNIIVIKMAIKTRAP